MGAYIATPNTQAVKILFVAILQLGNYICGNRPQKWCGKPSVLLLYKKICKAIFHKSLFLVELSPFSFYVYLRTFCIYLRKVVIYSFSRKRKYLTLVCGRFILCVVGGMYG